MKKLTIKKNTAAGILAGIMLAGCTSVNQQTQAETSDPQYEAEENQNGEVYGPDPAEINDENNEQSHTETESEDYRPDSNANTAVYGPPPFLQDNSSDESGENKQP